MKVETDLSCENLEQMERKATKQKHQMRFRIVRLAKQGLTGKAIADEVGLSRRRVYSWVSRFNQYGVNGLLSNQV